MVTIEKIDTLNKAQVQRFVELPFRIYRDCRQWVPPLNVDAYNQLDRKKHPFHEHSDVDFFLAVREGRDVGRTGLCAMEWSFPNPSGLKPSSNSRIA